MVFLIWAAAGLAGAAAAWFLSFPPAAITPADATPPQTGIQHRPDGKYAVRYEDRQVGLWTRKSWARHSLAAAKRTRGMSNW